MNLKDYVIILDDGHGTSTPGKRSPLFEREVKSPNRTFKEGDCFIENWFNQPVVDILVQMLQLEGADVFQTAPTHNDVSLLDRVKTERWAFDYAKKNKKKSIFISIHADAYQTIIDDQPQLIWNDKAHGTGTFYYSEEAKKLAEFMVDSVCYRNGLKNRGARKANFFVLRKTMSLSVLLEGAFMTNSKEAILLDSPEFQAKCALGVKEGLLKYVDSLK